MKKLLTLLVAITFTCFAAAQSFNTPLFIPDTLSGTDFILDVNDTTKEFYPGAVSPTCGYNDNDYLGPTLVFKQNDSVEILVTNNMTLATTVHWHGMHVPAIWDGGPHNIVLPNETWNPKFKIYDEAATMWYHSHLHHFTREQVNKGLAGMIIIQDDNEAALDLPREYGVDDIPVMLMDRIFTDSGILGDTTVMGDSILINGTILPYLDCPAQMVRFRVLNASAQRTYNIGISDNRDFSIIAGDGSLLEQPLTANRILVSPGERYEIVVDLSSDNGQTIYMMTYASELGPGITGGPADIFDDLWPTDIDGLDLNILELRVTAPNANALSAISQNLNVVTPIDTNLATNTRHKKLSGALNNAGERIWTIDGRQYNDGIVNDIIDLDAIEIWEIENSSALLHPFHIHSGHFYIIDRNGLAPAAHELGKKDVVINYPGETLRFIMEFVDFADNDNAYMYHCHLLNHEDKGMMAQFLVVDSSFYNSIVEIDNSFFTIINPVQAELHITSDETVLSTTILNIKGQIVFDAESDQSVLTIDVNGLEKGYYFVAVETKDGYGIKKFLKN